MGSFSLWHWIVVLVIVVLVFGTKKLRNLGEDVGGAVRGFKEGMKSGDAAQDAKKVDAATSGQTIEGEIKDKTKS